MQWSVVTPDGQIKEGPYKAQVDRVLGQFIYVGDHRFHFGDDRYPSLLNVWMIREGEDEIFIAAC
jgi:hypothetical protein